MNARRIVSIALAGFSLLATVARADLEVIYDNGATRPLAPFLEAFGETPPPKPVVKQGTDLGAADVSGLLPIRSPGLAPGPVPRRPLRLPNSATIARPFFLIGSDPASRDWLTKHRDQLKELGAVGMLVQAESAEDLEIIARIADGLPILPAPASDIGRALGIKHFPVLISRRGIEQ